MCTAASRGVTRPRSSSRCSGPAAGRLLALRDLRSSFVHVHVDWACRVHWPASESARSCCPQRCRAHGARRSCEIQRMAAELVAHRQALAQVFVGVLRPDRGLLQDDHADAGPQAAGVRGPCNDIRKKVHVVEAGGATVKHFQHRPVRRRPGRSPGSTQRVSAGQICCSSQVSRGRSSARPRNSVIGVCVWAFTSPAAAHGAGRRTSSRGV